jgi:hypothetical protein
VILEVYNIIQKCSGNYTMIDDPFEVMTLVEKLEASLPIPARPARNYLQNIRKQTDKILPDQELSIKAIHYMGDEGGICCAIAPFSSTGKEQFVMSITHLEFDPSHPLTAQIVDYQTKRTRNILRSHRRGFDSMLPEGSKKSKKTKKPGFGN